MLQDSPLNRVNTDQLRVEHFMLQGEQHFPAVPSEPDEATRIFRAKLILEETLETIAGLGVSVHTPDGPLRSDTLKFLIDGPFSMVETVDGCCDIQVVTLGTLSALGVDAGPHMEIVHDANDDKFRNGLIRRDDGKVLKPADWQPPDHVPLLVAAGWAAVA